MCALVLMSTVKLSYEIMDKFDRLIDWDSDEELDDPIVSYGGPDGNMSIGVEITKLEKHFPDAKIGEMRAIAARELSRVFGEEIPVSAVNYIEEGWYNG